MNKVLKGFIIGALVCIVLGVILFVAAFFGGGKEKVQEYLGKNNGRIGALTYSIGHIGKDNFKFDFDLTETSEENYASDKIENLDINFGAGELEIKKTFGDQIVVQCSEDVVVKSEGNTLRIRSKKRDIIFNDKNFVIIEIPESVSFDNVTVNAGAAELSIERIEANNIDIDLGAGALHADEFVCKNGTFNVGAGEVDIENGCIKNTSMDVGMGAIFYGGIIQGPLEADCGMGAISLELEGDESDYNYNIDVDAGDVQIGERSYSGIGYSDYIDNGSKDEFDLDCDMGSISIAFE